MLEEMMLAVREDGSVHFMRMVYGVSRSKDDEVSEEVAVLEMQSGPPVARVERVVFVPVTRTVWL